MLNNYVPYAFMAVFLENLGSIIILQMYQWLLIVWMYVCASMYIHTLTKFCWAYFILYC